MQYQHGGDIYTQEIHMDYSANLNPLGLPDGVRKVLASCIHTDVCSVYPDSRGGSCIRPGPWLYAKARTGDGPGLFRI